MVTYTLKYIKGTQAFFDYTQDINMNFTVEKAKASATGSGGGKMVYDMPTNYITDTTGDITLDMKMQMEGENWMRMNLKAKTSVKAKLL
jgi:hypothetical protein